MLKLAILLVPIVFLFSCDKNKEMVRYTSLYHIERNDTISYLYIPNSFTPNSNAINDDYRPTGYWLIDEGYEMIIYDSNGGIVYQSSNIILGWDGTYKSTIAQSGTYDCIIKAKDSTGYLFEYSGKIELLK